jgi:hypothetical protein
MLGDVAIDLERDEMYRAALRPTCGVVPALTPARDPTTWEPRRRPSKRLKRVQLKAHQDDPDHPQRQDPTSHLCDLRRVADLQEKHDDGGRQGCVHSRHDVEVLTRKWATSHLRLGPSSM